MGRIVRKGKTYLNLQETCEVLECADEKVFRLARAGRIEWVKLKGIRAKVYTLQSIVDYLAAQRMLNGLTVDDIALTLVRMENRLRRVEATLRRRKDNDLLLGEEPGSRLLTRDLERLKSSLGLS